MWRAVVVALLTLPVGACAPLFQMSEEQFVAQTQEVQQVWHALYDNVVSYGDGGVEWEFRLTSGPHPCKSRVLHYTGLLRDGTSAGVSAGTDVAVMDVAVLSERLVGVLESFGHDAEVFEGSEGQQSVSADVGRGDVSVQVYGYEDGSGAVLLYSDSGCEMLPSRPFPQTQEFREGFWEETDPDFEVLQRR